MSYLSPEENTADLANQVASGDKPLFRSLQASRVEAAFEGRVLVLYQPTGLTREGAHREPLIKTILKIRDFYCDSDGGADFEVMDVYHEEKMRVGHVPSRVFDYDVFMAVPNQYRMRWDARYVRGNVVRSLVFPVMVYTKNRSSYYSAGVTYAETPNKFKELFPTVNLDLYQN